MTKFDLLISCASWEERFVESLNYHNKNSDVDKVLILGIEEFFDSYPEQNTFAKHFTDFTERCLETDLILVPAFDDVKIWSCLESVFSKHEIRNKRILLDVSTMPRYLIWYVLHFLDLNQNFVEFIYFSPESYEDCDWLTEEAMTPRLILKHSGIYLPNRNSVLIIQTGFDIERVSQLINTFEPERVFLGVQQGEQLNNMVKNINLYKEKLNYQEVEYFAVDAFSGNHGYDEIKNIVTTKKEEKNVLMASFGPKLVSIEMFKLNQEFPEIGLVDVPVKKYNKKYSHGINLERFQTGKLFTWHAL